MFKKLFGLIICDKCGESIPMDLARVSSNGECLCNYCRK